MTGCSVVHEKLLKNSLEGKKIRRFNRLVIYYFAIFIMNSMPVSKFLFCIGSRSGDG